MLFPKLATTPSVVLRPSIHRVLLDKRGSLARLGLLPFRPLLAMVR
jgi:hypothetical protein